MRNPLLNYTGRRIVQKWSGELQKEDGDVVAAAGVVGFVDDGGPRIWQRRGRLTMRSG